MIEPGGELDDPTVGDRTATPTVVDRPPRTAKTLPAANASITRASGSAATTTRAPLDVLKRDEVLRSRRFIAGGLVIAVAGLIAIPLLPGDPTAARVLLAAISVIAICLGYVLWRTRGSTHVEGWAVALGWYLPVVGVCTAIPYFGAYSAAPILLVLGIYFIGLGANFPLAIATYLTCAIAQFGTALLAILGIIDDVGIVRAPDLTAAQAVIVQVLIQLVLGLTFIIARVSRRTALVAITELEAAVRAVAHREALLAEAREELERALESGRGRGRFSEAVIGNYTLGDVIGRGSMGEVYEATTTTGEAVAVKLLAHHALSNPDHIRRFFRELKMAAAIDSPNVVKVLAVGEQPVPHLVMERLDGVNLSESLRGRRALPLEEAVELVRQLGAGIAAAHAAGVIHRDLKPQNVVLHRGTWKVLDFGVSRFADQSDTLTGAHVIGTPSYMAPEQASGNPIDHRADVYALGAIAYRALTGHPPHTGRDIAATLYAVVHDRPRRPSQLAKLPTAIDEVLALAMAKDPDRRFASAPEVASALTDAIAASLSTTVAERARALGAVWS